MLHRNRNIIVLIKTIYIETETLNKTYRILFPSFSLACLEIKQLLM